MRILHITRYFQPGMGYQENGLLAAQMRLGHQVRLITSDRYHPHPDYKETMKMSDAGRIVGATHQEEDGLDVVRLNVLWEWKAHWWVLWGGLWRAVREFQPDIIHTHCAVIASSTFQILWGNLWRRYPIVVDDHNNYFNIEPYVASKKFLYKVLFRRIMRPVLMTSVGRVLAISHEVRDYLDHELGIPPDFVTINTLGAKPELFHRQPEEGSRIRRELGIPEDAVVIVNAGKITRSKDNDVLLEAMGRLIARTKRPYLIMIGGAPAGLRKELDAIIQKHGLGPHVRWIDFLPNKDLPAVYSAADIGVWPGDASITYLECASCGVPLVLPDREYSRYALTNDNGVVFERGNAEALAEALYALVLDDARRIQMGERSRTLIERDLNWDALARQTIEVYQRVIEARTPKQAASHAVTKGISQ
ncbi:MAG TPA: glycosyltransferase family 4 protein [Candidatus Hydrogenedentes bacterium]|nr:glycosyltransferase family 4 protein [Candidatus Hydrogenedentota bacterium]